MKLLHKIKEFLFQINGQYENYPLNNNNCIIRVLPILFVIDENSYNSNKNSFSNTKLIKNLKSMTNKNYKNKFKAFSRIQRLILNSKGHRIINSNYNRNLLDFFNLNINKNKTMNMNSKFNSDSTNKNNSKLLNNYSGKINPSLY